MAAVGSKCWIMNTLLSGHNHLTVSHLKAKSKTVSQAKKHRNQGPLGERTVR